MRRESTWTKTLHACFVLLAFLGVAFAFEARADAETPPLVVTWTAPDGCPDGAWVESAVLHLVTTPPTQALEVKGTVREMNGRYRVDLELQGAATGKRTLGAATCASVARGAALIIALALDPQASVVAREEPAAAGEPRVAAPLPIGAEAAAMVDRPAPTVERAPPPKLRPYVFLGASASRVLVPGMAFAVTVGEGVAWRAFRMDLSAEIGPSTSTELPSRRSVGGDFSWMALALRPCAGHVSAWFAVYGCAGLRGVRITGEATGLAVGYRKTAHTLVVEPGALLRFPARSRWAVEADVAAAIPLARPDFVFLTNGPNAPLFRVSGIGPRATLGIGFLF